MSDWSEVNCGDVILGKDGEHWTVVSGGQGGHVTIVRSGVPDYSGTPSGPVTIVSRAETPSRIDEVVAMGLIATKLGGVEIGKQPRDKNQPWLVPKDYLEPGSLLAHLRIFHNALSDDPTHAGLTKFHADLHRPEHRASDLYEPHVHDPDYDTL